MIWLLVRATVQLVRTRKRSKLYNVFGSSRDVIWGHIWHCCRRLGCDDLHNVTWKIFLNSIRMTRNAQSARAVKAAIRNGSLLLPRLSLLSKEFFRNDSIASLASERYVDCKMDSEVRTESVNIDRKQEELSNARNPDIMLGRVRTANWCVIDGATQTPGMSPELVQSTFSRLLQLCYLESPQFALKSYG